MDSSKPATVLVVDDDPAVRDLMRLLRTEHGFTVIEAASGAEVEPLLARHTSDIALLDLGLPDIGGPTCSWKSPSGTTSL